MNLKISKFSKLNDKKFEYDRIIYKISIYLKSQAPFSPFLTFPEKKPYNIFCLKGNTKFRRSSKYKNLPKFRKVLTDMNLVFGKKIWTFTTLAGHSHTIVKKKRFSVLIIFEHNSREMPIFKIVKVSENIKILKIS